VRPLILLAFSLTAACSSPFGAYEETEDPDAALDDSATTTDEGTSTNDTSTPPKTDSGASATDTGAPPPPPTDSGAPPPPADTGPPSAGGCSLKLAGATGKEADGMIPVCCQPGSADKAAIMEVFKMVNDHRAANGKAALVYDEKLEAPIQGHCEHMRTHTFFAHDAPESAVSSFTTRASKCGASAGGENIAWGYPTAAAVMDGWKKSSGHNANMLNGSWKRMAVGKSGTYWGQMFGP
jgi:uncharacterized protein YkwD